MSSREIETLTYVIGLLDAAIEQQQRNVDEWLARVEFLKSEGWDDMTAQAGRILERNINELQELRQHKERLQSVKMQLVSA